MLKYMAPLMVSLAVQFEPIVGPLIGWAVGVALPPGMYTWIGGGVVLVAAAGATVATAKRQEQEAAQAKGRKGMMKLPTHDLDDYEVDVDTLEMDQAVDSSMGKRTYELAVSRAPAGDTQRSIATAAGRPSVVNALDVELHETQSISSQPAANINRHRSLERDPPQRQPPNAFMDIELGSPKRPAIRSHTDTLTGMQGNSTQH